MIAVNGPAIGEGVFALGSAWSCFHDAALARYPQPAGFTTLMLRSQNTRACVGMRCARCCTRTCPTSKAWGCDLRSRFRLFLGTIRKIWSGAGNNFLAHPGPESWTLAQQEGTDSIMPWYDRDSTKPLMIMLLWLRPAQKQSHQGPMIASEMVLFSKKKTPEDAMLQRQRFQVTETTAVLVQEMHRCGLVNEILPVRLLLSP